MNNFLSWWQWGLLAAVPLAIIALYFLKLKRVPLEVPSTYLWKKSIEDLHVNSLWQRLRQSLLLLLQLLLILLLLFALMNFTWRGEEFAESRYIFLIDNSASMQTKDVGEAGDSRLAEAKRRTLAIIEGMKPDDAAMIISFNDTAQVVQQYSGNRQELIRKVQSIQPTNRQTSIADALRLASGLANPGRSSNKNNPEDVAAAEAKPANLIVMSDFRFPEITDFALGNLAPRFEMLGDEATENVGIVNFTSRRPEDKPDELEAFARIENFAQDEVELSVELLLDGELVDAKQVTIEGKDFVPLVFPVGDIESGVLELRLAHDDALAIDNRAWTIVNPPRRRRVLFVSPGDNRAMEQGLKTSRIQDLAEVEFKSPAYLETEEYALQADGAMVDLVIYDRCSPKKLPLCNTFFMGSLPPDKRWAQLEEVIDPKIIDTERTHPLMQVEVDNIRIYHAFTMKRPSGGTDLIESDRGTIFAIAPRDGFEDAVLGFTLAPIEEDGALYDNTSWPKYRSFPVFVHELLVYLAGANAQSLDSIPPGRTYPLWSLSGDKQLTVHRPDSSTMSVRRNRQNTYECSDTEQVGVYEVRENDRVTQRFAVNMHSQMESHITPDPSKTVRLGNVEVEAEGDWKPSRRGIWKLLVLLGLAVLIVEWYIYNRRVYV